MRCINNSILADDSTALKYRSNKPFPHIMIKDFLKEDFFRRLVDAMSEQVFEHKESDLFSFAQTKEITGDEHPVIKEFMNMINSDEFFSWIKKVTGKKVNKASFFGGLYHDTDYLLCHDDRLEDRKVAFILYLTTITGSGGELVLYDTKNNHPDRIIVSYPPLENSIVLFTVSKKSHHAVNEVIGDIYRVSIGGWFHGS